MSRFVNCQPLLTITIPDFVHLSGASPSAYSRMSMPFIIFMLLFSHAAIAEGQFVDIAPKNKSEIQLVLNTLEASITHELTDLPPIVMMLHGDEAHRFLKNNYANNKSLVDQAAKLAAYDVVKVQICAIWLQTNNYTSSDLFPFISTVPYGAGELERLAKEEGYREYSVNL